MEDYRIIELLFARSEQGIQALEEKFGRLVTQISEQILCNEEDAKECQNDTYLAIWNTIPPKNPEYLKAYICKIARNISLKKVRNKSARKRSDFTQVALEELGESVPGGTMPQDIYDAKQLAIYINMFLDSISEENRMLFIRRYFFGDSVDNLAERFNMRPNTVSTKLSRLRKSLRSRLEEEEVL